MCAAKTRMIVTMTKAFVLRFREITRFMRVMVPEIGMYQPALALASLDAIPVEPGKGWIVVVESDAQEPVRKHLRAVSARNEHGETT
jgi:hypothetical protein